MAKKTTGEEILKRLEDAPCPADEQPCDLLDPDIKCGCLRVLIAQTAYPDFETEEAWKLFSSWFQEPK